MYKNGLHSLFLTLFVGFLITPTPQFVYAQAGIPQLHSGEPIQGVLTNLDSRLQTGSFADRFAFMGQEGEEIQIDLYSSAFDTYLSLISPSGRYVDNDDASNSKSHSQLRLVLPETGNYIVSATSYLPRKTGAYTLILSGNAQRLAQHISTTSSVVSDGMATSKTSTSSSRVFGLFIGISEYNGRATNLSYTAQDAHVVRQAMLTGLGMSPSNGLVLTDRQATETNFQRAMYQFAKEMTPNDVFILFFSGHGFRVKRSSYQAQDPDGYDETLELYDGTILDDELDVLLGMIPAKLQIVVIDACFSGGFAKDIISRPNRMGLFSSEEDLESNVAAQFKAGGYLSFLFAEGVKDGRADLNKDNIITALELSQYVQNRFQDVSSQIPASASVTDPTYISMQRLVVDRGSIRPNDVLFFK